MINLAAHDRISLLTQLGQIDISVPPRGRERKTEHTERWSICRLLATLAWEHKLSFPCIVKKSECPDYCVKSDRTIGIEITEAVKEDLARAHALPKPSKDGVIDLSLFRWRDRRKTLDELRSIVSETKLIGPGWSGDAPEKEFADAIADRIEDKTVRLNQKPFSRFDEDWLLLYENLSLPALNESKAASYLCLLLSEYWSENSFHRVFVESGRFIIELSRDSLCMNKLCDLWREDEI